MSDTNQTNPSFECHIFNCNKWPESILVCAFDHVLILLTVVGLLLFSS